MLAARSRRISLVTHAVDDAGSACGKRPRLGRWKLRKRGVVNCIRCLHSIDRGRYSFCETPSSLTVGGMVHIRRVGVEGIKYTGSFRGNFALCGSPVGWDLKIPVWRSQLESPATCGRCRTAFARETR